MARRPTKDPGLRLLDELVGEGFSQFTSGEAALRLSKSPTNTANLLARLERDGLIDRVRRGHYVIRPLGSLGTEAAEEDVLLAVAAGFAGRPHRVGYRTALERHGMFRQPSRAIQVALGTATRTTTLSGRSLITIVEPPRLLHVGAVKEARTWVSDLERALLDAASRPELAGGLHGLAEAIAAAADRVDPARLADYARQLEAGPAIRRIGSIADAIDRPLGRQLEPLAKPTSDLELEPGRVLYAWRDARWWMRWSEQPAALRHLLPR